MGLASGCFSSRISLTVFPVDPSATSLSVKIASSLKADLTLPSIINFEKVLAILASSVLLVRLDDVRR